jgi:NTP pyrophosphatase (non-canonical NTP hydrolase)
MELRDSVDRFAQQMERKLRANDHRPGWMNDSPEALLRRLREEVDELEAVVKANGPGVVGEAADVANFAMMIAEVAWLRYAEKRIGGFDADWRARGDEETPDAPR